MKLFNEIVATLPEAELWTAKDFKGNALIIDLETTGVNFTTNRIKQIGCTLVRDGEMQPAMTTLIKTPYDPVTWSAVYAGLDPKSRQFGTLIRKAGCDIETVHKAIDENDGSIVGLDCVPQDIQDMTDHNGRRMFVAAYDITGISSKSTMEHGIERVAALKSFNSLVTKVQSKGWPIIGHNHFGFDLPFLQAELTKFCDIDMPINWNLVIDTGLVVKGEQCRISLKKDEPLANFHHRVADRRSRVKWDLERFCFQAFDLGKFGVDQSKQHKSAGYDTFVNGCLVKALL